MAAFGINFYNFICGVNIGINKAVNKFQLINILNRAIIVNNAYLGFYSKIFRVYKIQIRGNSIAND